MPTTAQLQQLRSVGCNSLLANVETVRGKRYLAAGHYQFRSLWTRDFLWSVRGLLRLEGTDDGLAIATGQLDLILDAVDRHPEGSRDILARVFDSMRTELRVPLSVVFRHRFKLGPTLHEEVEDQHHRIAFDGNMLAVLVGRRLLQPCAPAWWDSQRPKLMRLLRFYDDHRGPGGVLLQQPPFSDWQDSVNRSGATFYCNLVYAAALEAVKDDPAFGVTTATCDAIRAELRRTFFDPRTGVYRSRDVEEQVSLDGNLLAIDLDYLPRAEQVSLYERLLEHALWTAPGGPGFVTQPDYPYNEKDHLFRWSIVGLRPYHDALYWSWLIALAAKVSLRMAPHVPRARDEARKLYNRLVAIAQRDGVIGEVYESGDVPYVLRAPRYKSDQPFSWGAAFVIDAADYALKNNGGD